MTATGLLLVLGEILKEFFAKVQAGSKAEVAFLGEQESVNGTDNQGDAKI